MKAKKCYLQGFTSYGYPCGKIKYPSISSAKKDAKEYIEDGFWFSYKIYIIKE